MSDHFIFKKSDKVGVADAADDGDFLIDNFIDTGDYSAVIEFGNVERFILGGAGIGKTALITKLAEDRSNVIVINPDSLSMSYISSSNIISYLTDLNVNFDLFYRMLWRHVLVIEVLKYHFGIDDENTKLSVLDRLKLRFERDPKKRAHLKSLEYLEKWGPNFWQTTNLRVKRIKDNFENKVETKAGAKLGKLMTSINAGKSINKEIISEVTHEVKEVISSVQMKELGDLIKLIDDAIDDPQKQYYVVIDKLDENWVDEKIRYQLIKALLVTVKDFEQAKQVKPIVVLRNDLINRVFDQTKDTGFQEEKYRSLYLDVSWTEKQLLDMLNKRVKSLVRRRYTKQEVSLNDMLPATVKGVSVEQYFIDRSLMRPRYMIELFNECIKQAVNSPIINVEMLLLAEREYSRGRRSAIHDEWRSVYPSLEYWDTLLSSIDSEFFVGDLKDDEVNSLINNYDIDKFENLHDRMTESVKRFIDTNKDEAISDFKRELIVMFYSCGYIGIKSNNNIDYWAHGTRKILKSNEIQDESIIKVNPTFNFAFNIAG